MNKRFWIKSAAMLAVLPQAGWAQQVATPARRPNVIFVLSDDQGYGDFGCYGNPYLSTPNMDRLYRESTRLPNFYMCPVCAPTRASLMTGQYPYRVSVWDTIRGGLNMKSDALTIAEILKGAGYKTSIFGKWHLGYNCPFRPEDQGFDEVLLWDMFHKQSENRKDPVMLHNSEFMETHGFEDDVVFDYAINYLKQNAGSKQPFFMYVASCLPHDWVDYMVPPEYVEKFKKIPELSQVSAEALGMVEKLDENLGRLLKTIDDLGLTRDTIVIYTSDNGPLWRAGSERYNRGLRGQKATTYEGGIRLPFFIRWPSTLPAGVDIDQVGSCIDFSPTVLEMCGVAVPAEATFDGISLWPQISGKAASVARTFAGQFYPNQTPDTWKTSYIREGDYKLVNGSELYCIKDDFREQNDLSKQMPEKSNELRQKYESWFKDVTKESVKNGEFTVHPILIGTEKQRLIDLRYSDKNPKVGWPMKIISTGPYRITVTLMQNDLFDETSELQLLFGDTVISKKILPNDGSLVFENVNLPVGICNLMIKINGTFRERRYRFSNDVGHRNIYIEQIRKTESCL